MKKNISQLHKKAQTSCLNQMMDMKLMQIRQKTHNNTLQSSINNDFVKTDVDEYFQCPQCLQYKQIIRDLEEQIHNQQRQIDILKLKQSYLFKKEEQKIYNELQNKNQQIQSLIDQNQIQQSENSLYAEILHKSLDFSLQINIKFNSLHTSMEYLSNLIHKYIKITQHFQTQTTPQLELFLPNKNKSNPQTQLEFSNLEDMSDKIQTIQLNTLNNIQQTTQQLISLLSEQLKQVQNQLINDMSTNFV